MKLLISGLRQKKCPLVWIHYKSGSLNKISSNLFKTSYFANTLLYITIPTYNIRRFGPKEGDLVPRHNEEPGRGEVLLADERASDDGVRHLQSCGVFGFLPVEAVATASSIEIAPVGSEEDNVVERECGRRVGRERLDERHSTVHVDLNCIKITVNWIKSNRDEFNCIALKWSEVKWTLIQFK